MLDRAISGGQTGADRGGLRAARASGLPTGGYMPRLYLVESPDGRSHIGAPEIAQEFGLIECPDPEGDPPPCEDRRAWAAWCAEAYKARTARNALGSDGTVWFGSNDSRGFGATASACRRFQRPLLVVKAGATVPRDVVRWIEENRICVVNIAGNRASTAPDIEGRVIVFLGHVFARLGHTPQPSQ